jgi:hypothetical protein
MSEIKTIEEKGSEAVRKMRRQKLSNGHPFMINSRELVSSQCYLEYPDGIIKLVLHHKSARNFTVIRELTELEANLLRKRYNLFA